MPRSVVRRTRLFVTPLEAREVPAVTIADFAATDFATDRPYYLPVTGTSSTNAAITYTAAGDANSTAEVLAGGRSLRLTVTGTDRLGQAFEGDLTLRLFESAAPLATARIIQLAQQGFYDNLTFHRVIDNFVIQGGDPNGNGTGGSNLGTFADEFNKDFTFTSNGLLALANSGDETNNSQFFITDIDRTLAQRPQHLTFNHTIFGILTSGFDTFTKIITTNTNASDAPTSPVTIKSATVFEDKANGVVKVTAKSGYTGPTTVSVTGTDGDGSPATESAALTAAASTSNDRAFLNVVPDPSVSSAGGTFTLASTDREGDAVTYKVGTPGNLLTPPSNLTVSIDQATGKVTATPTDSTFRGTVNLLVGVRDQTDRSGTGDLETASNYDTQPLTLTVREPVATGVVLSSSVASPAVNQPVLFTATVTGDAAANGGTVTFATLDGTTLGSTAVVNGTALLNTSFAQSGARTVTASFTPAAGGTATASNAVPVTVPNETNGVIATITAAAVPAGTAPRVIVRNEDGSERFTLDAYEASFTGGVRVAVADVSGDGQQDVIVAPGFGGAPLVRVFNGRDGAVLGERMVFEDTFRGGLYLAADDAFARGYAQILVGAGDTGGPRVTLFDAKTNEVLLNYFAYDPNFRGGVSVSLSDLRGGERMNIITGAGKGGGPRVNVYDASGGTAAVPALIGSFQGGDADSRTGIRVGAGELNATGNRRNILVGPFEPDTAALDQSFDPFAVGVFVGS